MGEKRSVRESTCLLAVTESVCCFSDELFIERRCSYSSHLTVQGTKKFQWQQNREARCLNEASVNFEDSLTVSAPYNCQKPTVAVLGSMTYKMSGWEIILSICSPFFSMKKLYYKEKPHMKEHHAECLMFKADRL